jgi:hypothetical protein
METTQSPEPVEPGVLLRVTAEELPALSQALKFLGHEMQTDKLVDVLDEPAQMETSPTLLALKRFPIPGGMLTARVTVMAAVPCGQIFIGGDCETNTLDDRWIYLYPDEISEIKEAVSQDAKSGRHYARPHKPRSNP